jgi:hypothetical protein
MAGNTLKETFSDRDGGTEVQTNPAAESEPLSDLTDETDSEWYTFSSPPQEEVPQDEGQDSSYWVTSGTNGSPRWTETGRMLVAAKYQGVVESAVRHHWRLLGLDRHDCTPEGITFDDMLGEGFIVYMDALDSFDPRQCTPVMWWLQHVTFLRLVDLRRCEGAAKRGGARFRQIRIMEEGTDGTEIETVAPEGLSQLTGLSFVRLSRTYPMSSANASSSKEMGLPTQKRPRSSECRSRRRR